MSEPSPESLTLKQVAAQLPASKRKVADLVKTREMPSYKVGRRRYVTRAAFDAYRNSHTSWARHQDQVTPQPESEIEKMRRRLDTLEAKMAKLEATERIAA